MTKSTIGSFDDLVDIAGKNLKSLVRELRRVTLRHATLSDTSCVADCVKAAYQHYIGRIGKPPGPMLDDFAEVIEQHSVFIAEIDTVVGVLVLIQDAENILLDNIAVHPDQQGKGIGKSLINLAESETIKHGYKKLQLYTHQKMTENIEIYKSLGFVETERKNVQGYDRVYMEKHVEQ